MCLASMSLLLCPRDSLTVEKEWIKHSIWKDDCRSWYKNNETGRVNGKLHRSCPSPNVITPVD